MKTNLFFIAGVICGALIPFVPLWVCFLFGLAGGMASILTEDM